MILKGKINLGKVNKINFNSENIRVIVANYLILVFFFFGMTTAVAQKPIIDSGVFGKWQSVVNPAISNDGVYASYAINNLPVGSFSVVFQSTDLKWKMIIPCGCTSSEFTDDSHSIIFKNSKDSLGIVALGTGNINYIPNVNSFKLFKIGKVEWLSYLLKNTSKDLILLNLSTGEEHRYSEVSDYLLSDDGRSLALKCEAKNADSLSYNLKLINVMNGDSKTVWVGKNVTEFIFDGNGSQLAFLVDSTINDEITKVLWCFKVGDNKAVPINYNEPFIRNNNLTIDDIRCFGKNGNSLFVEFSRMKNKTNNSLNNVQVDVWSYKDTLLQSMQLKNIGNVTNYLGVINLHDKKNILLDKEGGGWVQPSIDPSSPPVIGNYFLITHSQGDVDNEWNWNSAAKNSVYLINAKDGIKKTSKKLESGKGYNCLISPKQKYLVYFDTTRRQYFSYSISTGATRNITEGIRAHWTNYNWDDCPTPSHFPIGVAGWLENDSALLIYDQHDIFEIDPEGKRPFINLTNGYGRKHNIVFRLAMQQMGATVKFDQELILSAFNFETKEDGYFKVNIGKLKNPLMLTMQPYVFNGPPESQNVNQFLPVKARDCNKYLVRRMNASESPNYFVTADFITFLPLSNIYPEKAYNWLNTELITWKTLDGGISQGILYKPANFDPRQKYPVIVTYYEQVSESLHAFIEPNACDGPINIPYFVSRGYLVFRPDIHYKVGSPGQSALNSVISSARYLTKMPWVNGKRLGIQGHSFGGFETDYIVTHSNNIFAAAVSASGMSDFISAYGSIIEGGSSRQRQYELYRDRIGATLWQRGDLYIKNSPVLFADRVKTPILMMNNKDDGDVPFSQGTEFFTALRRLNKKAWMLQYDGEGHTISGNAGKDFTIRITQFFDYYLKGAAPPKWMTEGVPAKLKGIETGLELDYSGKKS